jgi:hypothetical protein
MNAAASLQHFMEEIRLDNSPLISPQRFAVQVAMEQRELARFAGVHRNTLARTPQSPALQGYLRDSVRVIAAASDVSGDADRATYWYRNQPLAPFAYKTPSQVVSEGKTEDLLRYVEMLAAGAAG